MRIHKLAAGATVAALLMPALSFAESSDVQSQMQSLMSQIQALQLQLKTLMMSASTTMPKIGGMMEKMGDKMMAGPGQMGKMACITLNRNLRQGSQGDDVKKIQELLIMDPESGFTGGATGFFGPLTARAMMKFQMRMGIASSTDGAVGPLTRGFFERACGKGLGQGMGPGGMQKTDHPGGMMGPDIRGVVAGTITAQDGTSITLQTKDGIFKTVYYTASTTIMVAVQGGQPTLGSATDLVLGKTVMAEGKPNMNGGIDAHRIKVGELPGTGMMLMKVQGGMMGGQ